MYKFLNSKQREVFNVVFTWPKDYLKYDGHDVEPVHMFLSSSGGTGKFHLVKVIYNAISRTLLDHCKDPEKPRFLLLERTGISAVIIVGTTIHSRFGVKPGTKLFGLNDKSKVALRNRLSEAKSLVIDELSMVSSELWTDVDSRLREMFMMIPAKAYAGFSVIIVADFLQVPLVRGKLLFSQFSDEDSMKP